MSNPVASARPFARARAGVHPLWALLALAAVGLATSSCQRGDEQGGTAASASASATQLPTTSASSTTSVPTASASGSATSPKACAPRTGTVRLLWMDAKSDIQLAHDEIACLSDAERAAVGYVGTVVGSECRWTKDPDPYGEGGHMECKLTKALGLGLQCEDAHKSFLKQWLGDDIPPRCWKIPITAFSQAVLDELTLTTEGNRTIVAFKASGTTGPGGKGWSWSEKLIFEPRGERLKLAKREVQGKPF